MTVKSLCSGTQHARIRQGNQFTVNTLLRPQTFYTEALTTSSITEGQNKTSAVTGLGYKSFILSSKSKNEINLYMKCDPCESGGIYIYTCCASKKDN